MQKCSFYYALLEINGVLTISLSNCAKKCNIPVAMMCLSCSSCSKVFPKACTQKGKQIQHHCHSDDSREAQWRNCKIQTQSLMHLQFLKQTSFVKLLHEKFPAINIFIPIL